MAHKKCQSGFSSLQSSSVQRLPLSCVCIIPWARPLHDDNRNNFKIHTKLISTVLLFPSSRAILVWSKNTPISHISFTCGASPFSSYLPSHPLSLTPDFWKAVLSIHRSYARTYLEKFDFPVSPTPLSEASSIVFWSKIKLLGTTVPHMALD